MKALLMYRDRDFDPQQKSPWNAEALIQDLELNTLFNAMALGDKFLVDVAQKAVLSGLQTDLDTMRYRQAILTDCLKNTATVRDIYDIADEHAHTFDSEGFTAFFAMLGKVITGANQGGKSTFLRSIEEDTTMKSGKLDEELSRMSDIIDHITSYSMVLVNESFAATNEREGSEIARQIITALLEKASRCSS